MTIGTCKLCLAVGAELRASHGLPASVYRSLRDENTEANPNPWEITRRGARQTSHQDRAPLLCGTCEQLFSKNGERWVFTNGLKRDGSFPLARALAQHPPVALSVDTAVYRAADIPAVNIAALTYFAASMFWRATVHPWRHDGTYPVTLGATQEDFRKYLLGEAGFPVDTTLVVALRVPGGAVDRLTYAPMGEQRGDIYVAKFPMPGFGFSLAIGKNLPQALHNTCFVRSDGNLISLTNKLEAPLLRDGIEMYSRIGK